MWSSRKVQKTENSISDRGEWKWTGETKNPICMKNLQQTRNMMENSGNAGQRCQTVRLYVKQEERNADEHRRRTMLWVTGVL